MFGHKIPVCCLRFELKEDFLITIKHIMQIMENANIKMRCSKANYFQNQQIVEFELISMGFINSFMPILFWNMELLDSKVIHMIELQIHDRKRKMLKICCDILYVLFCLFGYIYWLKADGLFLPVIAVGFKYTYSVIEISAYSITCKSIEKRLKANYDNLIVYWQKDEIKSLRKTCGVCVDIVILIYTLITVIS